MLRVGFVLRSTEIQPVCFRFVSPTVLLWVRRAGCAGRSPRRRDLRDPREPRGGRRGSPGGPAKIFTPQLRWYAVQEFPLVAGANRREPAPESAGVSRSHSRCVTPAREIWDPSCVGTRFKNFPWSILGMTWCAFFCGRWSGPPQLCLRSPTRVGPSWSWIPFGDHPLKLERYRED